MDTHEQPFKADLDALLTPISTERLAGDALRYEPTYDLIKEARRADDPTLPQGIYVTERKKADWARVEALCAEALATRSKDLQLAVWLMEAWMNRHGFTGAREGLILISGLVEGFWEDLYPPMDKGDLAVRLTPFEWLDDRLSVTLKQLPITRPDVGDLQAYSFADKEWAERTAAQPPKDRQDGAPAEAHDRVTHPRFLTSVTMTPTPFYQGLHGVVSQTLEAAEAVEAVLAAQCGEQVRLLYQFRGALGAIQAHAAQVLREREAPVAPGPSPAYASGGEATVASQAQAPRHQIRSRADAYRLLLEAAEYLAKTEPHSPTPYLVRRAVSWGGMTLVELMEELVKERSDLTFIYELLGVQEES